MKTLRSERLNLKTCVLTDTTVKFEDTKFKDIQFEDTYINETKFEDT